MKRVQIKRGENALSKSMQKMSNKKPIRLKNFHYETDEQQPTSENKEYDSSAYKVKRMVRPNTSMHGNVKKSKNRVLK